MLSKNRKRSIIALSILIAMFAGSIIINNPDFPYGICIFRTITGIPCPSCGMTHSFVNIGHLKITDGFKYNIMGPFMYFFMLVGIIVLTFEIYFDRLIIYPIFKRYEKIILVGVFIFAVLSWGYNLYRFIRC